MKKYKLLLSISALSASSLVPVISLASCTAKTDKIKAIPEQMLDIQGDILCGLNKTAVLDAYDTLVIPDNIVAISAEAFKDVFKSETCPIKTIVFNKNLMSIGKDAFYNCNSITRIDLSAFQDIKLMALRMNGTDVFAGCNNSAGKAILPEGLTDMQREWIVNLFTSAGLPESWFNETSADQEKVNEMNTILTAHGACNTMSDAIDVLAEEGYYLETEQPANTSDQFVWDREKNVVFEMNASGAVSVAPKDYKLNDKKANIWKMVKPKGSTNAQTRSTTNSDEIYADEFSSDTVYSQYLRTGYDFPKELSFQSGLDTGNQEKLILTYTKPETETNITPVINTMKCELTIEGSLDSIDHYGNLSTLTVESLGTNETYTEYGSVDAAIVIKSGSIIAETGSDINEVIVDTTDKNAVSITITENGSIGTVGATNSTVASNLDNIVDDSEAKEEGKPTKIKDEETSTPTESTTSFYTGKGTEKSPFCIVNAGQLELMRAEVNKGNFCYFNLARDIDMSGVTWTPVGTSSLPFKGVFNGCGFTIKNLTVAQQTEGMGLFGYVKGENVNQTFKRESSWDDTNKCIKSYMVDETYDNAGETIKNYDTAIKNVYFDDINITAPDTTEAADGRGFGAVAGFMVNTYVDNVAVNSGIIDAYRYVGGIAGDATGCSFNNCTIGTLTLEGETPSLTFKTNGNNVGGITGACGHYEADTLSCESFRNCVNYANITVNATGGYVGGIAGMCQQNAVNDYMACVFENCANYGDITTDGTNIDGIAGSNLRTWLFANCSNYGDLKVTGTGINISGIGGYGLCKYYQCNNWGDISGYCNNIAGIGCVLASSLYDNDGLDNCSNKGNLSSTNTNCKIGQLLVGGYNSKSIDLINTTFANVAELNAAINSTTAVSVNFRNVVVTDKTGELDIKPQMQSVGSDLAIAETIKLPANGVLSVNVPDIKANITTDLSNSSIAMYGDNNQITISDTGKIDVAAVSGTNSKIINNGTANRLGLDGAAEYGENNGTTQSVTFGHIHYGKFGTGNKTFNNNGTISCQSTSINDHVVFTIGGSDCNITLNNKGTINYTKSATGANGYLLYFNTSGTVTVNCDDNSELSTDLEKGYLQVVKNFMNLNYKDTAKLYVNTSTPLSYTSLESSKIHVTKI